MKREELRFDAGRRARENKLPLVHKLYTIEVKGTVPDDTVEAMLLAGLRGIEFDLDRRSHVQVGNGEKTHASDADVHPERFDVCGCGDDFDGIVPPLPRPAT